MTTQWHPPAIKPPRPHGSARNSAEMLVWTQGGSLAVAYYNYRAREWYAACGGEESVYISAWIELPDRPTEAALAKMRYEEQLADAKHEAKCANARLAALKKKGASK